jgi:hypothetical protein
VVRWEPPQGASRPGNLLGMFCPHSVRSNSGYRNNRLTAL